MSESPRLASKLLVSAIRKYTESDGDFATILTRGDETAGAIYIVMTPRGGNPSVFSRQIGADFNLEWVEKTFEINESGALSEYLRRAKERDPDLWILEVDVAETSRFIARLPALG